MLATFIGGAVGVIVNPFYTLRLAFGSLIVLALLRYRYLLLVAWALVNVLIASTLPVFSGSNFLTGLTAPTLLLLFYLPVKQAFRRLPAIALMFVFQLWVLTGISISPISVGQFLSTLDRLPGLHSSSGTDNFCNHYKATSAQAHRCHPAAINLYRTLRYLRIHHQAKWRD